MRIAIVGGGHNGLICAAYLARARGAASKIGSVTVFERRSIVGGAAVTEEIIPDFKFSRFSYLAGLLRPDIVDDLGLEYVSIPRNPSSFTPTQTPGRYLMLSSDAASNRESIAQFSTRDAERYDEYEEMLAGCRELVQPMLDSPLPDPRALALGRGVRPAFDAWRAAGKMCGAAVTQKQWLVPFYELFTAPAAHVLDRYFESDVLKATLATDSVIGAQISPYHAGSGYVLLHHVLGTWAYVKGGMGAISQSIAARAEEAGVDIRCDAGVERIVSKDGRVRGVALDDGTFVEADVVVSNANPHHTFTELMDSASILDGGEFLDRLRQIDYKCGAMKINLAVDRLPDFTCCPSPPDGSPGPQHRGTIHFLLHNGSARRGIQGC